MYVSDFSKRASALEFFLPGTKSSLGGIAKRFVLFDEFSFSTFVGLRPGLPLGHYSTSLSLTILLD